MPKPSKPVVLKNNTYYFAYGSNLHLGDFKEWCRGRFSRAQLIPVTTAWLVDWKIQFHYYSNSRGGGAADVVPMGTKGCAVPGVVFRCNDQAWEALDRKEGHPNSYKRVTVTVTTSGQQTIQALTYVCAPDRIASQFVKPTPEYVRLISTSLTKFGLPKEMLDIAKTRWIQPSDASNIPYIFVYRHFRNRLILERSKMSDKLQVTRSGYIHANSHEEGAFPEIKTLSETQQCEMNSSSATTKIVGELCRCAASLHLTIQELDSLHGIRQDQYNVVLPFKRVVVEVFSESASPVWAWTYVVDHSSCCQR